MLLLVVVFWSKTLYQSISLFLFISVTYVLSHYNLADDYCNRSDHQGFRDFINSASDIEKAKAICNAALKGLNGKECNDIKDSGYYWIERTSKSTVNETVEKVERHFGFVKDDFSMDALEK